MDFFVWQGAGGVNSWLFTTSATQAGGKRRDFMARYGLGLVSVPLSTPAGTGLCRGPGTGTAQLDRLAHIHLNGAPVVLGRRQVSQLAVALDEH